MIPVYVPSKGRAGRSSTLDKLPNDRDVTVVTLESEAEQYLDAYPWCNVLTQRGIGIGRARQGALEHARAEGHEALWMLDDDITGVFRRAEEGKYKACDWEFALTTIETTVGAARAAMGGPGFRNHVWREPAFVWDRHLRNFVLIRTDAPADYWPHVKEDLDFVLQVLQNGRRTLRVNLFAFDSPAMGTSTGGCADDYAAGALEEASKALVKKWPGIVGFRLGKRGYIESPVNWRALGV